MKQHYLLSFLLVCFLLFSNVVAAQSNTFPASVQEKPISGLSIYPNPVTGNKVYITSDKNQSKEIEVYNVLGKVVLSAKLIGKELDVSELTPGIYILKIREGNTQATRKLVVK
ncbi:T9SS type A sorting domain-containing protein [Antarcticibacterium flavum]|uniref:T9SS type A sorting domain-containing protein n=1 Tax=Antarcticibacterium flavum TaxID=2058175 RepID=A0A5B7X349_9FLAO|nr:MULTISPECIES: T9SS type A sorting domain-containing protein [Antarcticibacterium]MCM4159425.1 T9SS C-terminal target domain-containing protein [Antarcticibacterium sp. W02-3]QCY69936.1 T9SS type A sorting domain-containing protein [Antarcticibacterium flavum]